MQLQAQAEDLNVANLLEMGNIATTHFPQRGWGPREGRLVDLVYALVSGQEDPRTGHRGHTIHLNLTAPVRFPDEYLLFHKVFEAVAEQGGLSGYAHAVGDGLGTVQGLALEGAFDLIDFVEVAQGGQVVTRNWFDLLNLGLRIAPAAGTDYPYLDHPGAVRNYVHVPGGWSVDGWFAGLGAGHTFVTTGPLVSLSINGKGMGEELRVAAGAPLTIEASASLNPDIDRLDRVEIIEQGTVVATQAAGARDSVEVEHRSDRESQHLVRGAGRGQARRAGGAISAVSAPIYVVVDGDARTWKRDAVPGIVERLVKSLDQLQSSSLESTAGERVVGGRPGVAEGVVAAARRSRRAHRRGTVTLERAGRSCSRAALDPPPLAHPPIRHPLDDVEIAVVVPDRVVRRDELALDALLLRHVGEALGLHPLALAADAEVRDELIVAAQDRHASQ